MAPTIEAETAAALESLNNAERTASSIEARIDGLNSTLDSLLEQLEKGGYVSPEALRQISTIESQIQQTSSEVATIEEHNASIVDSPHNTQSNLSMQNGTTHASAADKHREKQEQDKLLDMMGG